ncbi:hypothetical protein [Paraburkholderia sp. SIMBA_054]|uniref:hypothetical protein n=1 Tax=Paraburkholderia sp. SIMBA_054 TaxID=3085795 RepID=UPI00397B7CBA
MLDIEGGASSLAYSAGERLMLYVGDMQWLSTMIYGNPEMGASLRERGHLLPSEYDLTKLAREMDEARDRLSAAARRPRDEADELEFMARRLEAIGADDTHRVAELARKAETTLRAADGKRAVVFADLQLFESIWAGVSRALDRGRFAPEHRDTLCALEKELAGYVYGQRLAAGTLVRREPNVSADRAPAPRGLIGALARYIHGLARI